MPRASSVSSARPWRSPKSAAGPGVQPAICRQSDGRRPASATTGAARRLFVQRWFLHAGPAPVPFFQPGPQSTAIGRVRRSLQCSEYAQPGWIRHEFSTDRFLRPADRAVQPGVRIGRAARIPTGRAGYFLARPGPSTAAQYSRRPSDSCAMTRSRKRSSSSTSSLRKTVSAMVSRSVARNSFLSR